MNQILSLREKRAKLWNDTKTFLDSHRGEDGMMSAEDNATYEKMEADVVALGNEIERMERQAAIDRKLDKPVPNILVSKECRKTGGQTMTDSTTTAPQGQTITNSAGPYGWICPKCGRGLAPWVSECNHGCIGSITWESPLDHIVYTTNTGVKDD